MTQTLQCISPVDGSVYVERSPAGSQEISVTLDRAAQAQAAWKRVPMNQRQVLLSHFVDAFVDKKKEIAAEISWQMGRPVAQAAGEVNGFEERARHMIDIAPQVLADVQVDPKPGFIRFIRRQPLGVVLTVAAWNYPYLIAVNSVVPALMAGNAVVLKHSSQTPLCGERFAQCFQEVGLPEDLYQVLHLDHSGTERAIQSPQVNFVAFTGSVSGGHAIQQAASRRFIGVGLELGGKDPAYVRSDVNLEHAVENLVDGAFFNSGQSCCGIERIYVHAAVYDEFLAGFVAMVKAYRLGNPISSGTNLGPLVRTRAADFVRDQINEAVVSGASALIDPGLFSADQKGTPYLAPQVLVDVDHSMRVMSEESFGPVVGIMKVASDEEAVALMNDSEFGLTASIWTTDAEVALSLGERINTGTWFMNRCDYLDPALAWVGVKHSGRGCTLSPVGYEHLTRPQSFHLRTDLPS